MKKSLFATIAAFAIASAATTFALAEDGAKKDADKPAPTYTVQCDSPCSFSVSGHDKKEVVAIVIEHAKTHHNMNLTEKDVEGMVKTTEAGK
jgi:predicted small metal-binding protein